MHQCSPKVIKPLIFSKEVKSQILFFLLIFNFLLTTCHFQENRHADEDEVLNSTGEYELPLVTRISNLPDSLKPKAVSMKQFPKPVRVIIPSKPGGSYSTKNALGEIVKVKLEPPLKVTLKDNSTLDRQAHLVAGQRKDITNFTTDQGLALDAVNSSFLDHAGNLWFGTPGGGVSKYDGKSFTTFSVEQGLAGTQVTYITEDHAGNLWFGTSSGISKYDGYAFTNFSSVQGLLNNNVTSIHEDRHNNIWFATPLGISRLDSANIFLDNKILPESKSLFINFTTTNGLLNNNIRAIEEDEDGNIWIGSIAGISKYDGERFTNYSVTHGLIDNNVRDILRDRLGNLWIATRKGISRIDPGEYNGQLNPSNGKYNGLTNFTTTEGLANNNITTVSESEDGKIWIGAFGGGVNIYDGKQGAADNWFTTISASEGLASNEVNTITPDHEGNVWIGTNSSGVSKYRGSSLTNFVSPVELGFNSVFGLSDDQAGNLWIGTGGNGVTKFDGETFINYSTPQGMGLNGIFVNSVCQANNGNVWISLNNGGICLYDGVSFTNYTTEQGLASNGTNNIFKDKDGIFWISTGNGLSVLNFSADEMTVTNFTTAQGLPHNSIGCVSQDKFGNIWIGTNRGGISIYDQNLSRGIKFVNYGVAQGIAWSSINNITFDIDGNAWIGTNGGGLSRLKAEEIQRLDSSLATDTPYHLNFENFTTTEGLPDNVVYDVVGDLKGNIFIGTNLGLTVVPASAISKPLPEVVKIIEFFNAPYGYPIKDINTRGLFCDKAGIIWAATGSEKTGLVRFDYSSITRTGQSPNLVIQRIKVNGENLCWSQIKSKGNLRDARDSARARLEETLAYGRQLSPTERKSMYQKFGSIHFDSITQFYSIPQNLVLPFDHNSITIEFNVIETDKPQLINYQYFLEGYDKEWSPISKNTSASFGNIAGGTYSFKVKAQGANRVWSDPVVYTFDVMPPWYKSWAAWLTYLVLAGLAILSFVRLRTRQLKAKHKELEKTVEERTHELKLRAEELEVINTVQEGLASKLDIQAIYDLVGDKIRDVFDTQGIAISYYNRQTNFITNPYYIFKGKRIIGASFELGKGLTSHVIHTALPLVINENAASRFRELGAIYAVSETEDSAKSWLGVPLISGGLVNGTIRLENYQREFAYSESDVSLLQTLANSLSGALENARLFDETNRLLKETEQRTAELAVINSVQEGLARELDMQGIYDLVGDRVQALFNAQIVIIATFDLQKSIEHFNYLFENGENIKPESRSINKLRQLLIDKKEHIYISTAEQAEKEYGLTAIAGTQMPKSLLFVPLLTGSVIRGYVSLQNVDTENAFSHSDIRLLETLANSMSIALENARLFDETNRLLKETEQRTAELAVINSVQEGLARELDMQGIYDLIGDRIQKLFNAQAVIIATLDLDDKTEYFNYVFENNEKVQLRPRPINKLRQLLIDKKQYIYISTEEQAIKEYEMTAIEGTKMPKSLLFVPLLAGPLIKGYVSLQNMDTEHAFSNSDIRLLETLGNSMSVALENARLFDETNRLLIETEQRTAELAVINSVQEGLAKELDMQGIYNMVGDRLCELFPDSQTLVIRTFNFDSDTEHWQYAMEKGIRQIVEPRPLNWNSKILINTRKPLDIRENYVVTSKQHGGSGVTTGQPPKSAVFVPMIVGDAVKGSISLQNVDKENAFTSADLRLLTTITNSMIVALENARLFDETTILLKETEQRTAELAVINSVQEGLVREMNINSIYNFVGNRIYELFDTQTLVIRTFDEGSGLEQVHYAMEKGSHLKIEPRPIIWANKQLIETKQPLLINKNYLETAQKYGGKGFGKGLPPKSALFVPMIVGDIVKGSVSLQNVDREDAFNESELRLLTTLTNSMSVALENARLFDETNHLLSETKQRASELSTVNNIGKGLASQLNANDLILMVGEQIKDLFKANIVYLAILNENTNIIDFPYQYGEHLPPIKLGQGFASKILQSGEPLLINKHFDESTQQLGIVRLGKAFASYLGVPILVGDKIIGVLSVQSTEQENRFHENDLRLLSTIASSVGVALNNATLFEDVKQAKMEAEEASKLAEKANEAKSAFLSTVSHELRTPLTSVLGFAKIIKKRLEEKIFPVTDQSDPKIAKSVQQVSENLAVVVSEGQRLTNLINDVLDLAKIEAGKMQWNEDTVSMQDVAETAIAATSSLLDQSSLVLIKDIDDSLPTIIGDKDKLIQVMVNLISNSVKFTPSGTVTCRLYKEKNEVLVSISDTGIGIANKDHAAVFEQFKQVGDTLTDKPKGTGLGLPICKEIIEHHGGRIWLESELGRGSTFTFAVPIGKQVSTKPVQLDELIKQLSEEMAKSQQYIKGKTSNILIVDDDDSIRSLLQQELGDAGYLIHEARNGKEALSKVRDHRPDLIILDIMMPEMNGFDVAAVLKNDPATMDIPIIVLSIVEDKARGFRIGVDRYLNKPIDTNELFTEIGNLLDQGKSKKKVMIVDEDMATVNTLTEVLKAKGYVVMESDGKELVERALANPPDIMIINSLLSASKDSLQALKFEKGMENVLFLVYQ